MAPTSALKAEKNIDEMSDLFVKGTSKFNSEIEYGLRIPEEQRVLVKQREQVKNDRIKIINEDPSEEIIASHFESRVIY